MESTIVFAFTAIPLIIGFVVGHLLGYAGGWHSLAMRLTCKDICKLIVDKRGKRYIVRYDNVFPSPEKKVEL